MQTHFSEQQKSDPAIRAAEEALRKCVHCGFCNATCPTYQLTGNELEGPRGRITLIQDLLETEATPSPQVIGSLDRCLSCLSCETTCPSGVSYRHLIDLGRERIEQNGQRPIDQGIKRSLLSHLLPSATWFRRALQLATLTRPFISFAGRFSRSIATLDKLVPSQLPNSKESLQPGLYLTEGEELKRVALILGCVQNVLMPEIDTATVRLLTRLGCTVLVPEKSTAGCCGALPHHLGKSPQALSMLEQNMSVWESLLTEEIDAVLMTASGCGSMLKDYVHLLPDNVDAKILSSKVRDLSQILAELPIEIKQTPVSHAGSPLVVAWQNPCSLQHGIKELSAPVEVMEACGFIVKQPQGSHLCCGSAGTYNLLQPELANQLGTNKINALMATQPDIVVSANIGCMTQLSTSFDSGSSDTSTPVLHLAQVIDWASGGPCPEVLLNKSIA